MDLGKGISVSALALSVLGALLVLAGIGLVATTARGLQDYHAAASLHGGEVIDLGENARPEAGQHGAMARVTGTPRVVEAPRDPDFNLRASTPVLVRHVEMFQWREIRVGDSVHYELDWVDHLLDAGHFVDSKGHANPVGFPIDGKQFDAGLVQLGGFKLDPVLLHAMPGTVQVSPDAAVLPENLAASFSRYQNYLVTSARPGDPRLGDVRVSWNEVPLQELTVVGRIDGDRLEAAADAPDGKGYIVQVGDVPLLDLFPDLPVPPEFVWSWRILSMLLASLGAFVLLSAHRERRDPLLALGLGALVVGVVAAVLWLGDMQTMGGWLAVSLVGLGVAVWRLRGPFFGPGRD
ncbi:TMEM43 family protein [Rhodanobacter ginsengiterrae]|uniref:TMEM43 family protein n=1 Tax=Rhodanobacter ginsengiterrae TaxID=2008451 RepID=UPI003CE89BE6